MSREVRRVPLDWQHPRDERGHYVPMFDTAYEDDLAEWIEGRRKWDAGEDSDRARYGGTWEEWSGSAPTPETYRPSWTEDNPPVGYQVYESVSEGTPVSPVFPDRESMIVWLMADPPIGIGGRILHLTREQAERFAEDAYAPSMVFTPSTGLVSGLEAPR